MKSKFYCKNCDQIFETERIKKEYTDPVFGPCVSYHAFCPDCDMECQEYFNPKKFRSSVSKTVPRFGNGNFGCSC